MRTSFLYKEARIVDIPTCRVLSLCSGVGGLDLGLKLAMPTSRTVAYMEIEAYACEILVKRMQEKILDPAPLWSDIKSFDGKPWRGKVDIITGGYPCQPFSVAGKKLGEKDPRHLWPHVRRIVSEIEPMLCFFENVGGHLQLGFEQVHDDLQGLGYKVKAGLFTAEEVGAPHRRERLFILAYRNDGRCNSSGNDNTERQVCPNQERHSAPIHQERTQLQSGVSENSTPLADGFGIGSQRRFSQKSSDRVFAEPPERRSAVVETAAEMADTQSSGTRQRVSKLYSGIKTSSNKLADTECLGCRGRRYGNQTGNLCSDQASRSFRTCSKLPLWPPRPNDFDDWRNIPENLKPAVYRMADGLADRVDRVRACGNGVVPLVAAYAFTVLTSNLEFTTTGILNERES